ncbi:cupin [Mycobacterium sp. 852013-50091_SCH5140682]|nr:cupin [Mycobacterium sp. 852013-50091_SCH5140682]
MAHAGKTIDHPLTGERLTFLETSATTRGEHLKVRLEMAPGGSLPRPHTHPRAEERFEVAAGRVQIVTSGKKRIAEAGETVIVPRGAGHVWGNPFDDPAAVVVTINPALNLETFFETWFGLARDGKLNPRTQIPSFLQAVLVMHDFRAEIGMPGLAGLALRGLGPVVSPLARARGYRSIYPRYSAELPGADA